MHRSKLGAQVVREGFKSSSFSNLLVFGASSLLGFPSFPSFTSFGFLPGTFVVEHTYSISTDYRHSVSDNQSGIHIPNVPMVGRPVDTIIKYARP